MAEVKYGTDKELEELANELLGEGVGNNKRSAIRDVEKMSYELGLTDELRHYDPTNDWDTNDSAFTVYVDLGDLNSIEPSICADVDDGNVRSENRVRIEGGVPYRGVSRQDLMRHIEDDEEWGSAKEDNPPLGVNKITSGKICSRCELRKRMEYFSPDPRGKQGRDNWCKKCRMGQKRENRRSARQASATDNEEE